MKHHVDVESFRHHISGIILIICAFLCVAIMNALAKVSLLTVPLGLLLFMQNFWAFCFTTPFLLKNPKMLITKKWKLHTLRAVSGLLSYACLFIAVKYISLVNATLLANSAPLFLPFVIRFWLGQKITKTLWFCLIIGFLGVFLIINPTAQLSLLFKSWTVIVALFGSLFSAIALQCIGNLGKTESFPAIMFWYFLLATVATIPFLVFQWQPLSSHDWIILISIGALLALIQLLLALAYKYASPTLLGPFNYSIVIFAGIIEWIYWKVTPQPMALLGIFLICLGGILVIVNQKQKQKNL